MKNYYYLLLFAFSLYSTKSFAFKVGSSSHSVAKAPKIRHPANAISTAPVAATCPAAYEEQDGFVIIEAESLPLPAGWQKKTAASGYTGSGYIDWINAENFSKPGIGLIETTVKITKTGKYFFQWRNQVGLGTSPTDHNDSWLRFPDASDFYAEKGTRKVYPYGSGKTPNPNGAGSNGWFKVYFNAGKLDWAWNSFVSDRDPMSVVIEFTTPGVYKLQLSARSKGHLIDRMVMYHSSISPATAQALNRTETVCLSSAPVNQAPVVSNPIADQVGTAGLAFNYSFPSSTFSDPNGDALTYTASLSNGGSLPAWLTFNPTSRSFSGTPASPTTLALRVTANDGLGGLVSDEFTVSIGAAAVNLAPTVNAGPDKLLDSPTTNIILPGSASDDSQVVSTVWTQVSGPAATLTAANSLTLSASGLTANSYVFRLTATDNQGASASDEVTVTVKPAPAQGQQVVSYSLMDADTDQEIKVISDGEVVNLATLPTRNLNIRANTNPVLVGSVKMVLGGKQTRTQTETGAPYALFGDTNGDYKNWTPGIGSYTLTTTPYTGPNATGTAGLPLTVGFTVIQQTSSARVSANLSAETTETKVVFFPNPFRESFTLQVKGRPDGKQPVTIYNTNGQLVLRLEEAQADQVVRLGQGIAPGLYLLHIGEGKTLRRYKLLKVR